MQFDYLIVGSGLFGSVFGHEMTKLGKKCLIIDKREHIGGNIFTENVEGINVHKYGPHIFHTNDEKIWNYVNRFAEFNTYKYKPLVSYNDKLFSFPINFLTFHQLWGVKSPNEIKKRLDQERLSIENPKNFEEYVLSQVGEEVYNTFFKGYTKKQWGLDPKELPSSIIKRIPIRYNYDDNYYFDKYQGIPIGGYTKIIEKMLKGIPVELNIDFFDLDSEYLSNFEKILYTGKIDEYYNYKFGELDYRSLKFETKNIEIEDYQGTAGINYTDYAIPYTRIIEHKHFEPGNKNPLTIITKEYPIKGDKKNIPYYPVNNNLNNKVFKKYKALAEREKGVIFGGRLAEYRYYDMHQIIGAALKKVKVQMSLNK